MPSDSPTNADVQAHCRQIDRCNQRGGRMLSIVDLIEAGTMPAGLAAYARAAIGGGASFLVGASPGGAGKTTVMGALLNFVPAGAPLAVADALASIDAGLAAPQPRQCFICHEIGPGPYYAYLWGEALRRYLRLAEAGHMLATNLHADTPQQVRGQICQTNGAPEADLRRVNLMLFLRVGRGVRPGRRIEQVWHSDGAGPHRMVYDAAAGEAPSPNGLVSGPSLAAATGEIDALLASGARTIEQVRAFLTDAQR